MTRTYTPTPGQPYSLRYHLITAMDLVAQVGAQLGIMDAKYQALVNGQVVIMSAEQMRSMAPTAHPSLPPDLSSSPYWRLTGEDTLTASATP